MPAFFNALMFEIMDDNIISAFAAAPPKKAVEFYLRELEAALG